MKENDLKMSRETYFLFFINKKLRDQKTDFRRRGQIFIKKIRKPKVFLK